jgi:hypothetical protein
MEIISFGCRGAADSGARACRGAYSVALDVAEARSKTIKMTKPA